MICAMTTYVALLRGIMPTNPNMKSEKLKVAFESLGFKNVATVIASGNVVFDSSSKNSGALETKIEKTLPEKLGFKSTTIIRSKDELLQLVAKDPFKGVKDEKPNYLVVTFFKDRTPELASDPMPPNASDTFIILKPREAWPDPKEDKDALIARLHVPAARGERSTDQERWGK